MVPMSVVVEWSWKYWWGTDLRCGTLLRAIMLWCSWFPLCAGIIGIPRYWIGSNPDIDQPCHGLPHVMYQMMLCASTLGHLRYDLSVKAIIWDPCLSLCMVVYIDIAEARNSIRLSVRTPCYSGGIFQRHAMHLSLHPLIPYPQALDHSVTVGVVNTILFIGTPLYVTHCRIFIQSWRYFLCHY